MGFLERLSNDMKSANENDANNSYNFLSYSIPNWTPIANLKPNTSTRFPAKHRYPGQHVT